MSKRDITESRWWAWLGAILFLENVTLGIWFLLRGRDLFTFLLCIGVAIYIAPGVWEKRRQL